MRCTTKKLWSYGYVNLTQAHTTLGLFYAENQEEAQQIVEHHLEMVSGHIQRGELTRQTSGFTTQGVFLPSELIFDEEGNTIGSTNPIERLRGQSVHNAAETLS